MRFPWDDTGVLSQARPMMAAGARRGGRRRGAAAPKVRKSKYFISRSSTAYCTLLFLIISHYLSLSLTPFRPCSTFASATRHRRPATTRSRTSPTTSHFERMPLIMLEGIAAGVVRELCVPHYSFPALTSKVLAGNPSLFTRLARVKGCQP